MRLGPARSWADTMMYLVELFWLYISDLWLLVYSVILCLGFLMASIIFASCPGESFGPTSQPEIAAQVCSCVFHLCIYVFVFVVFVLSFVLSFLLAAWGCVQRANEGGRNSRTSLQLCISFVYLCICICCICIIICCIFACCLGMCSSSQPGRQK